MKKFDLHHCKKSQLADALGIRESSITRAISRGALAVLPDGFLDLGDAANYHYVVKRSMLKSERDPAKRRAAARLLTAIDKMGGALPDAEEPDTDLPITRPVSEIVKSRNLVSDAAQAELQTIIDKGRIIAARAESAELDLKAKREELLPAYVLSDAFAFFEVFFLSLCRNTSAVLPSIGAALQAGEEIKARRYLQQYVENAAVQTKHDMRAALDAEGIKSRFDECGKCRAAQLAKYAATITAGDNKKDGEK